MTIIYIHYHVHWSLCYILYALFFTHTFHTLATLWKKTKPNPQKFFRQGDLFPEQLCPKPTICRLFQPSSAKRHESDKPPHVSILTDKVAWFLVGQHLKESFSPLWMVLWHRKFVFFSWLSPWRTSTERWSRVCLCYVTVPAMPFFSQQHKPVTF